jgi:antitoxin ParD1/3/4
MRLDRTDYRRGVSMEERNNRENGPRVEELRWQIAIATEQIAKGQVTDGEVVFERLREKLRIARSRSE